MWLPILLGIRCLRGGDLERAVEQLSLERTLVLDRLEHFPGAAPLIEPDLLVATKRLERGFDALELPGVDDEALLARCQLALLVGQTLDCDERVLIAETGDIRRECTLAVPDS